MSYSKDLIEGTITDYNDKKKAISTIGSYAFYSCTSLSTASFPACTTISDSAFYNCKSLMSLYLKGSTVVALGGGSVFYSTPMSSSGLTGSFGSIYVPASLVESYQTATYWSSYSARIVGV